MFFAKRSEGIQESATLKLTAKIKALQKEGKDVISYGAGEPHFAPPEFLYEGVRASLSTAYAKYTPVLGLLEAREIISNWVNRTYRRQTQSQWIALTNGAKGAIHAALQVLLDPGDEVIYQSPYWVSYPPMVHISQGQSRTIPTTAHDRFRLTPQALEKAITPKTKIFLFNSPQNPTGVAYTQSEINELAAVLKRHPHIWILSDDIYDHILWNPDQRAHFTFVPHFDQDRIIQVQALSKSHGVTGWRAGFLCAHPALIQKVNIVMGHALGHISAINQNVLRIAYSSPFDFLKSWVVYYHNNLEIALPILEQLGAKTVVPEGAFYIFPEISSLIRSLSQKLKVKIQNDMELCDVLLERAHVGWVPGTEFGAPGYVRLSTALTSEVFQEGLLRVKHLLSL